MGVIVSSWSEITARYPELDRLPQVNSSSSVTSAQAVLNRDAVIADAEAYVHGQLAQSYSVPFSNNNYTAKDLVKDTVYVQNILSRQPVKGKSLADYLKAKIDGLNAGTMQMVTIAGTVAATALGDPVWSNTMNYPGVFDTSNPIQWAVNSQELIDNNNNRNSLTDEAF